MAVPDDTVCKRCQTAWIIQPDPDDPDHTEWVETFSTPECNHETEDGRK